MGMFDAKTGTVEREFTFQCEQCRLTRPISEFGLNDKSRANMGFICKTCFNKLTNVKRGKTKCQKKI